MLIIALLLLKKNLRQLLSYFNIALNRNMKYDILTRRIISETLSKDSFCIDVGAHAGEVLEYMCKYAPESNHIAFEPLPEYYSFLRDKFKGKATVYPVALSNMKGISEFICVRNAPAFSGLKKRKYDSIPELEYISIETSKLDDMIPESVKIDLIKIDVEGGEYDVLSGAIKCIRRSNPVLIFEFGLGASDYYAVTPEMMFDFIVNDLNQQIFLLSSFLNKKQPLLRQEFIDYYYTKKEYYFVSSSV